MGNIFKKVMKFKTRKDVLDLEDYLKKHASDIIGSKEIKVHNISLEGGIGPKNYHFGTGSGYRIAIISYSLVEDEKIQKQFSLDFFIEAKKGWIFNNYTLEVAHLGPLC